MTLTLATLSLILGPASVIGAMGIRTLRRIAAMRRHSSIPADWSPELSVDRYRPMFRLLDEADIRFLRSQPGATKHLVKRLRRQRYQVFQGYLASLRRDFQRGCEALMLVAVESHGDRDIVRALVVTRLKFSIALARVRFRLLLYRWNIASVPVGQLVGLFETLQLELLVLNPATSGARG